MIDGLRHATVARRVEISLHRGVGRQVLRLLRKRVRIAAGGITQPPGTNQVPVPDQPLRSQSAACLPPKHDESYDHCDHRDNAQVELQTSRVGAQIKQARHTDQDNREDKQQREDGPA